MLILSDTSSTINLTNRVFGMEQFTHDLVYTASYDDITSSAVTPGQVNGNITTATETTVISAPAASTQREVMSISVYNAKGFPCYVDIDHDNGTTPYTIWRGWLQPTQTLYYEHGAGFYLLTTMGCSYGAYPSPHYLDGINNSHTAFRSITHSPKNFYQYISDASALTGTRAIDSTNVAYVYMGVYSPQAVAFDGSTPNMQVRYRVTTAASSITWAEVAIYYGPPTGGNATLRLFGYANVASVVNSTGLKTTTVGALAGSYGSVTIPPGSGIWVAIGQESAGQLVVRAGGSPRVEAGIAQLSTSRPSTSAKEITPLEDASPAMWVTVVAV